MASATEDSQKALCKKYATEFLGSSSQWKIGIASNVGQGVEPINGFRHPPQGETTGWYVYAGETLFDDRDSFLPLHVAHLVDRCPRILRYLGLPPGWRFLIAGDKEDVWFDESLLDIQ